jgi:hypothetical protein
LKRNVGSSKGLIISRRFKIKLVSNPPISRLNLFCYQAIIRPLRYIPR